MLLHKLAMEFLQNCASPRIAPRPMSIILSFSPQNNATTTTTTVAKYQQFFFFFLNAHSKRLGWVFWQQIVGSQSNVRDDREKGLFKNWRYSNTKGCGWMLTWGNSSRASLRARGHRQGAGHSLWKRECDPSLHSGGDRRSAFARGVVRWMRSRRVCQRPVEGTFQCNCRTYFLMNAANMANTQIQHFHIM